MSTMRARNRESKLKAGPSVSRRTCKLFSAYASVFPLPRRMIACNAGKPSARRKARRNDSSARAFRRLNVVCLRVAGSLDASLRIVSFASTVGDLTRSKLKAGRGQRQRTMRGRIREGSSTELSCPTEQLPQVLFRHDRPCLSLAQGKRFRHRFERVQRELRRPDELFDDLWKRHFGVDPRLDALVAVVKVVRSRELLLVCGLEDRRRQTGRACAACR